MPDRALTYFKGEHQYSFRCAPGREGELIDHIMHLAEDADSNLDWLDAAMLSFGIARDAARRPAPAPEEQEHV